MHSLLSRNKDSSLFEFRPLSTSTEEGRYNSDETFYSQYDSVQIRKKYFFSDSGRQSLRIQLFSQVPYLVLLMLYFIFDFLIRGFEFFRASPNPLHLFYF